MTDAPFHAGEAARLQKRFRVKWVGALALIFAVFAATGWSAMIQHLHGRDFAAASRAYLALAGLADLAAADAAAVAAAGSVAERDADVGRLNFHAERLAAALEQADPIFARLGDGFHEAIAARAGDHAPVVDSLGHMRKFLARTRDPGWAEDALRPQLAQSLRLMSAGYLSRLHAEISIEIESGSDQAAAALGAALRLGGVAMALTLAAAALFLFRPVERRARRLVTELESARGRAESADLAKGQFLAAMSHELRTPLNGVLGMAALLEAEALNARERRLVDAIRESGLGLLAMVNDILDYSGMEAAAQAAPRGFSPLQIIEAAVEAASREARAKGLDFWLDIDAPETLVGSPEPLADIIARFAGNAVKFTESGEVGVSAVHDGARLTVSVRDSGPGVPEAERARVFERFTQLARRETHGHGGGGLGLALAARRAEAIGAMLGCDAAPEGGARFFVTAPAEAASVGPAPSPLAVYRGATIAIAEPRDPARAALARQIRFWGLTVAPIDSEEPRPALAVIGAPPDGAREAAAALAAAWERDLPVILIGGEDVDLAPEGALARLDRPFAREALAAALRRGLASAASQGASQTTAR